MRKVLLFCAVAPLFALGQQSASGCRERYQKDLEANPSSSLVHFHIGECAFESKDMQTAANEFRESLSGDLKPSWTEVWSRIQLGKIFDKTGQRDRALNEYRLARETHDNNRNAQDEVEKYTRSPYTGRQASELRAAGRVQPVVDRFRRTAVHPGELALRRKAESFQPARADVRGHVDDPTLIGIRRHAAAGLGRRFLRIVRVNGADVIAEMALSPGASMSVRGTRSGRAMPPDDLSGRNEAKLFVERLS
jgi:tetratricopeptide (TPR) repeat protein